MTDYCGCLCVREWVKLIEMLSYEAKNSNISYSRHASSSARSGFAGSKPCHSENLVTVVFKHTLPLAQNFFAILVRSIKMRLCSLIPNMCTIVVYCLCHKFSGSTETEDTVGASEWFESYSLGSLPLRSSSASLGDMNTFQIAFAEMPLSCSTVPNWPARANNKWDLHTVTSAIAGFALHIDHTFLRVKAVKFTEHLLLVERKNTFFCTVGI